MIDFSRILGFQWDDGNGRKNDDKHQVSQSEAEQTFLNEPLLVFTDEKHSVEEPRFHVLGKTDDGRRLLIACTLRDDQTLIRVISARDMNRRERSLYEAA